MKDNLLYVDARGLQVVYNIFMIALLWITRSWRSGHWYFDAETLTTPSNKVLHADGGNRPAQIDLFSPSAESAEEG